MWTNLGKQRMFEEFFEASSVNATRFMLQLASALPVPTDQVGWDANLSSTAQVGLVSASSIGTSGLEVLRLGHAAAGFNVSSAHELGASAARAVLQTAGDVYKYNGPITGARYVLLTEGAESAVTFDPTAAEVYAWWDIGQDTNIATGNTLTITDLSLQGN